MDVLGAVVAFLGGIGAGSVISAYVQHRLQRTARQQDLLWSERSEVFKGLLAALEALEVLDSVSNKKHFGFWAARASLVASDNVVEKLQAFRGTTPDTAARDLALGALLGAMRLDLTTSEAKR